MPSTDTKATARMTTQLTPGKAPAEVRELRGSQSEPGGPPVRVDPTMVNPSTAARMRPSTDSRHI